MKHGTSLFSKWCCYCVVVVSVFFSLNVSAAWTLRIKNDTSGTVNPNVYQLRWWNYSGSGLQTGPYAPSMSAGTTYTWTTDAASYVGGQPYSFLVYDGSVGANGPQQVVNWATSGVVEFLVSTLGVSAGSWKIQLSVFNNAVVPRNYKIIRTDTGADIGGGVFSVPSGQSYDFSYSNDAGKIPISIVPYMADPLTGGSIPVGTGVLNVPTSDSHWQQTSGTPTTTASELMLGGSPSIPMADLQPGGNGDWLKINYPTNDTAVARDQTLQTIGNVLYSASQQSGAAVAGQEMANGVKLDTLSSGLVTINGALVSLQGAVNSLNNGSGAAASASATAANTTAIASSVASVVTGINGLHADIGAVQAGQIVGNNVMTNILGQATSQATAVNAKVDALRGDVQAGTTAATSGSVALKASVDGMKTSLDGLSSVNHSDLAGLKSQSTSDAAAVLLATQTAANTAHGDANGIVNAVDRVKTAVDSSSNQNHTDELAVLSKLSEVKNGADVAGAAVVTAVQSASLNVRNGVDATAAAVNSGMSTLGTSVAGVTSAVNALSTGVQSVGVSVDSASAAARTDSGAVVRALQTESLNVQNKVEAITAAVNAGVSTLGTSVAGVTSAVTASATGVGSAGARVDSASATAHTDSGSLVTVTVEGQTVMGTKIDAGTTAVQAVKTVVDAAKTQATTDAAAITAAVNLVRSAVDQHKSVTSDFKNEAHMDSGFLKNSMDAQTNISGDIKRGVDMATNLLGQIYNQTTNTPGVPDVSAQSGMGATAAVAMTRALDGVAAGVGDGPPMTVGVRGSNFDVAFGFGAHTWTVHCDPMYYSSVQTLATWVFVLLSWVCNVCFIFGLVAVFEGYFRTASLVPQAHGGGNSVMGNSLGSSEALLCAGAIMVALGVLVLWFTNYWASHGGSGLFGANPLNGGGTVGSMVRYLLGAFIPVDLMFSLGASYLAFRWSAGSAYAVLAAVTRFIVG